MSEFVNQTSEKNHAISKTNSMAKGGGWTKYALIGGAVFWLLIAVMYVSGGNAPAPPVPGQYLRLLQCGGGR